jgi:hypothetical protein
MSTRVAKVEGGHRDVNAEDSALKNSDGSLFSALRNDHHSLERFGAIARWLAEVSWAIA